MPVRHAGPAGSLRRKLRRSAALHGMLGRSRDADAGRDLSTVRKRMGSAMACQDPVDMLGCAADMSLVSSGLPNGTNIP